MESVLPYVQTALLIAAIWYAWETRRLRQQGEGQLALLRKQLRLSVAPYLVPGVVDVDMAVLRKNVENNKELTEEERKKHLDEIAGSRVKYACAVANPTARVPNHLDMLIFDRRTQSFLEADFAKEIIEEKETVLFQFSEPYLSRENAAAAMRKQYGDAVDFLSEHLSLDDGSYLILLFRDLEGRLYSIKRGFDVDAAGKISHKPSALFFGG